MLPVLSSTAQGRRPNGGTLVTVAPASVTRRNSFQAKHAMWIVFGLMTLFVVVTRDRTLLDHKSFLRQRYAVIPWLMFAHGIPGALALLLGAFQFSNRLRQRHLQLHRVLGRIYVGCVALSAPFAIVVSISLPIMTPTMASIIQSLGLACDHCHRPLLRSHRQDPAAPRVDDAQLPVRYGLHCRTRHKLHPRDCTDGRARHCQRGLERHCDRVFPAVVRDCVAGVGCEPAHSKGSDYGMTPTYGRP